MAYEPAMRLCLSIVVAILAVGLLGASAAPAPYSAHPHLITPIVIVDSRSMPILKHPALVSSRGVSPDFSGFPADFNDLPIKTGVNIDGEVITIYALTRDHVDKAVPVLKKYLCGNPEYAPLFPIMCPAGHKTGKRLPSLKTMGTIGGHTAGQGLHTPGYGNDSSTVLKNGTTNLHGPGRSTSAVRRPRPGDSITGHATTGNGRASSAPGSRDRARPTASLYTTTPVFKDGDHFFTSTIVLTSNAGLNWPVTTNTGGEDAVDSTKSHKVISSRTGQPVTSIDRSHTAPPPPGSALMSPSNDNDDRSMIRSTATSRGGSSSISRTRRLHSTGFEAGITSELSSDVVSGTDSRTVKASDTRDEIYTSIIPSTGTVATDQAPMSSQNSRKTRAQTHVTSSRSPKSPGWPTGWRSRKTSSSNLETTTSLTETSRPRTSKSHDTSQTSGTTSSTGEKVSATLEPQPTASETTTSTDTAASLSSTTLGPQPTGPWSTSKQPSSSQDTNPSTIATLSQTTETTQSNEMPTSSSTDTTRHWESFKHITLTEMPTWRTLHPNPSATTTIDPGSGRGPGTSRTKPEWPKELTGTITVWPYTSSTSVMKRSSTKLRGDNMHTPFELHGFKAETVAWKVSDELSDAEYNRLLEGAGDYGGLSDEPIEQLEDGSTNGLSGAHYKSTKWEDTQADGLENLSKYQEWVEGVLGRARAEVIRVADTLSNVVGFVNALMGWNGED